MAFILSTRWFGRLAIAAAIAALPSIAAAQAQYGGGQQGYGQQGFGQQGYGQQQGGFGAFGGGYGLGGMQSGGINGGVGAGGAAAECLAAPRPGRAGARNSKPSASAAAGTASVRAERSAKE